MTDNITIPRATVQQALEAYESTNLDMHIAAIHALRTALKQQAEPVQKPFDDLATELFVVAQRSPADEGFSDTIDRIESWLREHFSTQLQQQAEPVAGNTLLKTFLASAKEAGVTHLQQAEPVGWLDGNDKLAEFMHRDLKAEHDKRGSATPRDFTVPVYTAPPQQQAEPECWCHKCNENRLVNNIPFSMTRMILCPTCGNKRCPKASDHRLGCTDSNAAGQPGSAYPALPQRKPLTDEEIDYWIGSNSTKKALARAIEAAHGIKEGT